MDVKTVAFAAMGVTSIVVLILHAVMHRRRLRAYRFQLTGEDDQRGIFHG